MFSSELREPSIMQISATINHTRAAILAVPNTRKLLFEGPPEDSSGRTGGQTDWRTRSTDAHTKPPASPRAAAPGA